MDFWRSEDQDLLSAYFISQKETKDNQRVAGSNPASPSTHHQVSHKKDMVYFKFKVMVNELHLNSTFLFYQDTGTQTALQYNLCFHTELY